MTSEWASPESLSKFILKQLYLAIEAYLSSLYGNQRFRSRAQTKIPEVKVTWIIPLMNIPWKAGMQTTVLPNYDPYELNRREIIPGTGNLANYLMLVNSWLLEENLQPLIYKNSIISNNNL